MNVKIMKHIQSFCCRYRKLTKLQKNIFKKYFSFFSINYKKKNINFNNIFHNQKSIILDIGFGIDNNIIQNTINNPQYNFIGIEVYIPGIINCLKKILINNLNNLKLIYYDVFYIFKYMIPANSIKLIQLYFPDPWPKLKHKKRRLLNLEFLKIIFFSLKKNGLLYVVTDCQDYNNNIMSSINKINRNNNKYYILFSQEYRKIYKNFNKIIFKNSFLYKAQRKNKIIYYLEYKKISF
ncbi:tRNA (guanosine(46)-N7)-methyltransferase TrmB [Enterobacteriaceae endosymbiont of Donacia tomentosa]|uniref:tRNA (guanosine(46)-N7)-methyltransferase TrmB n=1 Tax=Enterobacteriaceae endosymbiont of Donacia tomentosa TaxID=2675787 RepID=UPI0014498073|nr:tRNA (guanosine(46)-N7)-methyltransferase TrmB [Enterobacteriaceae endosymbiont of Donacia tomentosa]QJC31717.1 tRNA (guanosine(46)-N7)-methyltransferase TrmB [Enterobacteriaceae endosymbiont of Donacia tomentosa]